MVYFNFDESRDNNPAAPARYRRAQKRRQALYRWRRINHRNPFITFLLEFALA